MGDVAGAAVQVAWRLQSLPAARQLCKELLRIPSPGGSFFQAVIALEQAISTPATSEDVKRIRCLFEVRHRNLRFDSLQNVLMEM